MLPVAHPVTQLPDGLMARGTIDAMPWSSTLEELGRFEFPERLGGQVAEASEDGREFRLRLRETLPISDDADHDEDRADSVGASLVDVADFHVSSVDPPSARLKGRPCRRPAPRRLAGNSGRRASSAARTSRRGQARPTSLEDPSDLLLHRAEADLLDDDGMPDVDRIAEAARELDSQRPHLARRRPSGDVDQGARSEPEAVDLASMLRERAS